MNGEPIPQAVSSSGSAKLWLEHRLFVALILAHFAVGLSADAVGWADVVRRSAWRPIVFQSFFEFTFLGGIYVFLWHRLQVRDSSGGRIRGVPGWEAAAVRFQRTHLTLSGLGGVILVALGVAASAAIHDGWKGAIPLVHSYEFDPPLIAIDRAMHFGRDPWRLLHPILGSPAMTRVFDALYWWWYAGFLVGIAWQAWSVNYPTRRRFLVAYVLTWILLGSVVAHLFPSVGPCFLQRLTGEGYFEPLTGYLGAVHEKTPLVAIPLQDALWAAYRSGSTTHWMAISAMPSLHVAIPALFAVAARDKHRRLSWSLWVCTGLILVGSVHLGWHYAIDGYVGILGALFCWWVAGRLLRHQG